MSLEQELVAAVGPGHVLVDPDLRAAYEVDWTGRFHGECRVVVRPGSTDEVVAALAACRADGATVVVQGGNTGLVGGATPAGGEVVLSTVRLRDLGPVDTVAGQVTVGAGATLAAVQAHVSAAGFEVGVDLGARDSATIGGMVATNAGGERVLRHGSMRSQVVGVEAVLAGGEVLAHLGGVPKENTGYDWVGLLAGSEGTLAVVTRVRLRLVPAAGSRAVALVACAGVPQALEVVAGLRRRLPALDSAELILAEGLALVREHTGLADPMPGSVPPVLPPPVPDTSGPGGAAYPAYVLVEVTGASGAGAQAEGDLAAALGDLDVVQDAVVATEPTHRRELWRYRESHSEAVSAAGVPVKLDVAVPLGELAAFVAALPALVGAAAPGARAIVFGHLGEGNLHVNVLGAVGREHEVTDQVLRTVAAAGGSISAEHGIGRAKVGWLDLARSPAEIAAMRALKTALDPGWMLGPGVLLPGPAVH